MATGQDLVQLMAVLHNNNISLTIIGYILTILCTASQVDANGQASNRGDVNYRSY